MTPVLIIGGGIAGLTLALSLHQVGVACRIYESVAELRPLGVGINVLPHAVRELTELGLGSALDGIGVQTAELAYFSKGGQLIWSEPRGMAAGYQWPQYSIHRGELQMALLATVRERLGPDSIRLNHHLADWEHTTDGIVARFIERRTGLARESAHGAVLLGADGIHSVVRHSLFPREGAPVWNGAILWRGTTRGRPFLTGRSMIMAGHQRQKFVAYPISAPSAGDDGQLINWIAEKRLDPSYEWAREDWNRPGRLNDFLPDFAGWRFGWLDVPGLIAAGEQCYEFPMVDRDPLPQWTHGRVSLIGDAAHPMYPIGSNGASQAILDARTLARDVRTHGATPAALRAYEAERRPATAQIVLANRQNGPEQVMQLVQERAPLGFNKIEDVLNPAELTETASRYKRLAGFDKDVLNTRPSIIGE